MTTFTLLCSLHEAPHQHIVLTCFAENSSTSWSTFSWHSGLVASKYVAKDSVLVVVSYPAIRKRKAWPAISSSVNVFWTFSDGALPARGTSFWLEAADGFITSKYPAARESAESRESSIHWRKSLRLCRIQDEKKHEEWAMPLPTGDGRREPFPIYTAHLAPTEWPPAFHRTRRLLQVS